MVWAGAVFLALIAATILFHFALICGAPWGHLTMGGRWPGALPLAGRAVSALSILVLSLIGWVVAQRAGLMAPVMPTWAMWPVLGYLCLGVVANAATPSAAERALWLPVVLVMLAAALWVWYAGTGMMP